MSYFQFRRWSSTGNFFGFLFEYKTKSEKVKLLELHQAMLTVHSKSQEKTSRHVSASLRDLITAEQHRKHSKKYFTRHVWKHFTQRSVRRLSFENRRHFLGVVDLRVFSTQLLPIRLMEMKGRRKSFDRTSRQGSRGSAGTQWELLQVVLSRVDPQPLDYEAVTVQMSYVCTSPI